MVPALRFSVSRRSVVAAAQADQVGQIRAGTGDWFPPCERCGADGSGIDNRRPELRSAVTRRTSPIGSASGWAGSATEVREREPGTGPRARLGLRTTVVVLAGSLVAVRLRHRCSSIVLLCNSVDVLPIGVGANGSQRRNETLGPGGRIAVKRLDVVTSSSRQNP